MAAALSALTDQGFHPKQAPAFREEFSLDSQFYDRSESDSIWFILLTLLHREALALLCAFGQTRKKQSTEGMDQCSTSPDFAASVAAGRGRGIAQTGRNAIWSPCTSYFLCVCLLNCHFWRRISSETHSPDFILHDGIFYKKGSDSGVCRERCGEGEGECSGSTVCTFTALLCQFRTSLLACSEFWVQK